ncbi:hypothetical protein Tco_0313079 [Tanacetum coccineum]
MVVRRSWGAWRCGDDDGGTRVAVAVASWWRVVAVVDSWRWGGHGGDEGGVLMGGYGGGSEGDGVVVVGCRGSVAAGVMTVAW